MIARVRVGKGENEKQCGTGPKGGYVFYARYVITAPRVYHNFDHVTSLSFMKSANKNGTTVTGYTVI
jgi:hypothetical protein